MSFFLYIILPSIILPIIFYDTRNRPPDALTCRRGLLRQNPYLRPDIPLSAGLITAKFLSAPRYPAIDGAYYGKIPFCAPISRYRRGLLRQNLFLRPDILISPGLILAESLAVPRCFGSVGAYYGKILICAPISRYRRGLLRQNSYLRPDIPVSTGLITAKFLICAPMYKGGGYNRPGLVSHTRVRESRWV